MKIRYITYEEAVGLLPDGETVHTFLNEPFGLIGADWPREEVLDKLRGSEVIELTGPGARGLGHGIAAYNKGTAQRDIVFIETDPAKLDAFDPQEETT